MLIYIDRQGVNHQLIYQNDVIWINSVKLKISFLGGLNSHNGGQVRTY